MLCCSIKIWLVKITSTGILLAVVQEGHEYASGSALRFIPDFVSAFFRCGYTTLLTNQCCGAEMFFFGSGFGLFMKNSFEMQII
jgi:hypothetical protein